MRSIWASLPIAAFTATFASGFLHEPLIARDSGDCRCFPGDSCWPSEDEWNSLNETVSGNLVAISPLAAVCHKDNPWAEYDEGACEELRDGWLLPETHYDDASSIMAPYFANRSCSPYTDPYFPCVLGSYLQYTVNVTGAEDVVAGMKFAKDHNIRLIIRNTGHDYNGKSTGAGALGLWMHHLTDTKIVDWDDEHYTGRAIKMGAGVQGFDMMDAADAEGLQTVGGECPSVGIVGGYTQGGGHSALMSRHGMAADQALEWEVVTGTGEHLVANRENNTDIYWAMSGGGGGTYGIALSLTSKAHKDTPVAGMNMTFARANGSLDDYYSAIQVYQDSLAEMTDHGIMAVTFFDNSSFAITPITAPNMTVKELKGYLSPFEEKLDELEIDYTSYYQQSETYKEHFNSMMPDLEVGLYQYGGRLIPRSVVEESSSELLSRHRKIHSLGGQTIWVAANTSLAVAGDVDNAVVPGWRDNLLDAVITTEWDFEAPWEDMIQLQEKMTDELMPELAELTPGGNAYLNEGDFLQPDFQSVFYGDNYNRLLEIKQKYDPDNIFYAKTAVGSEYWEPQKDGRLCKANTSVGAPQLKGQQQQESLSARAAYSKTLGGMAVSLAGLFSL